MPASSERARASLKRWAARRRSTAACAVSSRRGFTKISALGVEEQRVWVVIDIVSAREARTPLGGRHRVDVRMAVDEMETATVVPIFSRE